MNEQSNPCGHFRALQAQLYDAVLGATSSANGESIYQLREQLVEIVAQHPQHVDLKDQLEKCDILIKQWESTWFPPMK